MAMLSILHKLDAGGAESEDGSLDSARAHLDALGVDETIESINTLLDWGAPGSLPVRSLCFRSPVFPESSRVSGCASGVGGRGARARC